MSQRDPVLVTTVLLSAARGRMTASESSFSAYLKGGFELLKSRVRRERPSGLFFAVSSPCTASQQCMKASDAASHVQRVFLCYADILPAGGRRSCQHAKSPDGYPLYPGKGPSQLGFLPVFPSGSLPIRLEVREEAAKPPLAICQAICSPVPPPSCVISIRVRSTIPFVCGSPEATLCGYTLACGCAVFTPSATNKSAISLGFSPVSVGSTKKTARHSRSHPLTFVRSAFSTLKLKLASPAPQRPLRTVVDLHSRQTRLAS